MTRQNNVHIFGTFCLRQSDERTNRYKTRDVVNTYRNVTFEDLFSNAPTPRKDRVHKDCVGFVCLLARFADLSRLCFRVFLFV